MKIGFDAKRAAQNRTGLGNYSRFILRILSENLPGENELYLYTPNPKKASLLDSLLKDSRLVLKTPTSLFWRYLKSFWRTWGVSNDISSDGVSLFHGLSNELPLNIRKVKETKSIVTIHDLIFLHYPECYHLIDRTIYNYKFRKACEHADRIIAVSERTKKDIIDFYHIDCDKIDVVYQGCDPVFKRLASDELKHEVKKRYELPDRFILYVGSIEKRKNLLLLIKAMRFLPDDIPVIAIGKHTSYADEVKKYAINEGIWSRIKMIHDLPFEYLPAMYRLSHLFVYPSRFEGFGIPIIEAIHSKVPVISCTGSCLEEAGGPSSVYVSPDDDTQLAHSILKIWNDNSVRDRMINDGEKYVERFNDKNIFADLMDSYGKTIKI